MRDVFLKHFESYNSQAKAKIEFRAISASAYVNVIRQPVAADAAEVEREREQFYKEKDRRKERWEREQEKKRKSWETERVKNKQRWYDNQEKQENRSGRGSYKKNAKN